MLIFITYLRLFNDLNYLSESHNNNIYMYMSFMFTPFILIN